MKKYYNVYMGERGYGKTNFELKTRVNVLENRINKAIEFIDRRDFEWGSKEHEYLLNILRGEDK